MTIERCIKLFLAGIKSDITRDGYLKNLNKFKEFCKFQTYSEFLTQDKMKIQEYVEDYVLELRESTHPNSIPTIYYPIQTFLEMNDVLINFKKIRRLFPARIKSAVERGWTTEEVKQMLSVAPDTRAHAIIHFENASGGRIGIFNGLKIKHLVELNDNDVGKCYGIIGYSGEREEYITFLTPEATKTLDKYFNKRKADGETMTKESPVFRIKYLMGSQPVVESKSSGLGEVVRRTIIKAGLRRKEDKKGFRYAIPANHGFRHRFDEIIKSVEGVNPHIAEKMFAHTSRLIALDTIYNNPNIEKMFAEYKKIIPYIMIDESEKIEIENQKLKRDAELNETLVKKLIEEKFKELSRSKSNDLDIISFKK